MKFNLKNRPEVIEGPVLTKENGAYDWLSTSIIQELKLIKFKEWFEGFESELRKKVVSPTNTKSVAVYDVIKEILGDE